MNKLLFVARNELENKTSELQAALGLSEMDMAVVLEMVLNTSRYKALVRGIYDEVKKGGEDNGNSNEKGQ